MKNIKLIEVPSEIGAGTRGASLGIAAIKIAALDFMSNFFVHFPSEKLEEENKLLYEPIQSPYAKRMQGVLTMSERISKAVTDSINGHFFPVVLSGDHSNAAGTIAGIKMAKPKSKLGVIWIDAHADLHTPYTTPSGNIHGMPMSASIAEDNMEMKVHELDEKTAKQWEQLKNMGKINPKVFDRKNGLAIAHLMTAPALSKPLRWHDFARSGANPISLGRSAMHRSNTNSQRS